MSLAIYENRVSSLVVNVRGGRASPHKICMLLAVLDLARAGGLLENRILFAPPLLERYTRFFNAVRSPRDHPNPQYPFFYLTGNLRGGAPSFWHLEPLPGREVELSAMRSVRSVSDITNNIAHAKLDSELFDLLQSPSAVEAMGDAISKRWFDRGLDELRTVVANSSDISRYELQLRAGVIAYAREPSPPAYIRDPAFRRVVTELYDYRCAATGIRILLMPSGEAMVEAAHIHPFHEAGDDDPRNGLALSPNMHWAMDRNLIAPGPDLKWHVSSTLDDRVPDFAGLFALHGKKLFLPAEARMYPKREVLEWRLNRLREATE